MGQVIKSTLERVLFETDVSYKTTNGETLLGRSCDLSVGGIYLQTKQFLSENETMSIAFSIPNEGGGHNITCKARVAWANYNHDKLKLDYPPGAGLEFVKLSMDCSSTLSKFINKYDENKKMNMICAWCGIHLGLRKGPYGKTSHGICSECKKIYF